MFYDLHMHSCLSPCAENEMTPNNICNMAMIKELDLIALTDHNSTKQLPAFVKAAANIGMRVICGCEIQTIEEVHILGLFRNLEDTYPFQAWIDMHMPDIPNRTDFFGDQLICNENDQVIGTEDRLLLVSLDVTLEETVDMIHKCHGAAVLAHVLDRENSVTNQLGFIPMGLAYDGLEVKTAEQKQRVLDSHPWIRENDTVWLIDSDAHRLIDMSEREHEISEADFNRLWGDRI